MLCVSTVFSIFVLAQPATTLDTTSTAFFPPNLFFVRATTVDLKKVEGSAEVASLLITHVYAGDVALNRKTFECPIGGRPIGISSLGASNRRYVDFLEKGTEGLWWLYFDRNEGKLRPELRGDVVDGYRIRRFPITNGKLGTIFDGRKHDRKAEWKDGVAWGEAVETVYRAKSDDFRAVILKRLAAMEQSPVAAWAINLIGKVNAKGTTAFLRTLASNERLSVESHIELDRTLSHLDYRRWRSSEHWERLLSRWIESPDLMYFNAGVQRLWEAGQNSEIDFTLFVKILDPVLAKADRLNDGQEESLGLALDFPPTFSRGGGDRVFDWLAGHVRAGKTPFVRAHAAAGLRVFGKLNPTQHKLVKALRDESKEPQVQNALDAILKSH